MGITLTSTRFPSHDPAVKLLRDADAELETLRETLKQATVRNNEVMKVREARITEFRAYERILRDLGYPGVDLY